MPPRERKRCRAARLVAALLTVAAALAEAPGPALADGLADEADLHFDLGRELFKKGAYRAALEHFLASNRLVPNRNVMFNIALTYEELGRFADAHRYYIDARRGETDVHVVADIDEAIERIGPHVAVLRIETSPPGATIYIDRKDLGSRGEAPRLLAIPEGSYRVIAELEGHQPAEAWGVLAKIGQETAVTLALRPIVGTVRVGVTGGSSARVHVGSDRAPVACVAPCALELPPGQQILHFSREGFQAAPQQVNVEAGQTTQATAELRPLTGSLIVHADERDALIEIDGRPVGFTPTVIQGVAVGRRRVRVTLRGFSTIEREVEVKTNQQAALTNLQLTPVRQVTAASRFVESIDDAPASVSVIDGQELRAFGYPTIADALRGMRGVYISNDRAYASAAIRGLGQPNDYGNRLLVLSDGQSLNDNVLFTSLIGSDARVDLHDIERIEVVRGPGSLIYGAGALSGIINMVPRGREGSPGVHAGAGTYDNAVSHARAGGQVALGRDAGAWLSASVARSDGVDVPVELRDPGGGPPVQTASGVEAFQSGGTAGRAWVGPLVAQWFFHTRKQQNPTGILGTRFNDPDTIYQDTRMMAELRLEKPIGEAVQFMARVHANRFEFRGQYAFDAPASEDDVGTWFGGEVRAVWTPGTSAWAPALRITGGAEAQVHPQASERTNYPEATLDIEEPYQFGAGYAIVDASPAGWLRASAGARLDYYSAHGPIFVPRGAVILKPTAGGTLKLMGGRAFRVPSVYEQYHADPAQIAALKLVPESIISGEVEYAQRFRQDWVAIAAVHASQIFDIIDTVRVAPGSELVQYRNSDATVLTAGADVELRREWRRGWMLGASYGYQRAQYLDSDMENPRLVNAPEHLASFRAVIPVVEDLASAGLRCTLEAPRRLSLDSDEVTRSAILADLTLSGEIVRFRTRYVLGIYNLMDARRDHPVSETFLARSSRQNGRTLRVDFLVSYP